MNINGGICREEDYTMPKEIRDMLSTLPREKGWVDPFYYKYEGFWYAQWQLQDAIKCQRNFVTNDSDILLASSPKCGTTWLKALAFTILNRMHYPPTDEQHPLISRNSHELVPVLEEFNGSYNVIPDDQHPLIRKPPDQELVPFLEEVVNDNNSMLDDQLSSWNSPRLFASHIPYVSLPRSLKDSGCKVIYVCRNPKGAFTSLWNFVNKIRAMRDLESISLEEAFHMFSKGVTPYGPFWDHALQYWQESLKKPNKILFLKYEELMEEPSLHVKRIAEFMGCPFSDDEEASGVPDEIVRLCSFNHLSNLEVNKSGQKRGFQFKTLFWKGEVDNWKNYLTPEMVHRIDGLTAKKFQGSGLQF